MSASLSPLFEDAAIKAEKKKKEEAEAEAQVALKKCRQTRIKKKGECVVLARPGRSITPSTDMEDMTSMTSGGFVAPVLVGECLTTARLRVVLASRPKRTHHRWRPLTLPCWVGISAKDCHRLPRWWPLLCRGCP